MKRAAIILSLFLAGIAGTYLFHTSRLPAGFRIQNMEEGRVLVLGHAGMGTRSWYEMNSREGFVKAMEAGADGTEMDVQLTADGHAVVFHDRSGGSCNGPIASLELDKLKSCIPGLMTVTEVLSLGWPSGSTFSLDIKLHDLDEAHEDRCALALHELRQRNPQFRILIESNSTGFLTRLKQHGAAGGLYLYTDDASEGLSTCLALGVEGISIRNAHISAEQVQQLHAKGLRVMLWGVGTRWDNRKAMLKGPDIIQSDRLGHMVTLARSARP